MSPEDQMPWHQASEEEWLALMGGNKDALAFVRDVAFWSHVYDDLVDRDKPVSTDDLHSCMWKVMIALPMNPFYRKYQNMLLPLIVNGILNWHGANEMEVSGNVEELRVSHVTRHSLGDIALMAMALAVDQSHAVRNARRVRLLMQTGSWQQYKKEHIHADS